MKPLVAMELQPHSDLFLYFHHRPYRIQHQIDSLARHRSVYHDTLHTGREPWMDTAHLPFCKYPEHLSPISHLSRQPGIDNSVNNRTYVPADRDLSIFICCQFLAKTIFHNSRYNFGISINISVSQTFPHSAVATGLILSVLVLPKRRILFVRTHVFNKVIVTSA